MALKDPVVVYYATSNTQAAMLCQMLEKAGCEAEVQEDQTVLTVPALHWPKVLVERAYGDWAAEMLRQFEQTRRDREDDRARPDWDRTIVTIRCEECGRRVDFSARVLGSVQNCPNCGRFIDVEDESPEGDWGEPEDKPAADEDDEKWS